MRTVSLNVVMWGMAVMLAIRAGVAADNGEERPGPWHEDERFAAVYRPAFDPGAVQLCPQVKAFLESMLHPEQMSRALEVLAPADAWGSLGPAPGGAPAPLPVDPPPQTMELIIPDDATGAGTAEDPYLNVISGFLRRFEFPRHSIEAYRSTPDRAAIAAYMEQLDYEPVEVIIPAGYYRETITSHDSPLTRVSRRHVGLDVPPGIWLRGQGRVVLMPEEVPVERQTALVNLNPRAGLRDLILDGGKGDHFVPDPDFRVTGVVAAHEAVIAGCIIRYFTNHGIVAEGSRGRAGAYVTVSDTVIEYVGQSGIRSQSQWYISDNRIRYAGILRSSGGGGDDGIIPAWGEGGYIVNNLLICGRFPHGRHVISGQACQGNFIAGNIAIAHTGEDGRGMRNSVFLSDAAHGNRLVGNMSLSTGRTTRGIQSFGANGYGNVLEYNVSINDMHGYRLMGRSDRPLGVLRHNYAESFRHGIHNSRFYKAYDNDLRSAWHLFELSDPDAFDLFQPTTSN